MGTILKNIRPVPNFMINGLRLYLFVKRDLKENIKIIGNVAMEVWDA